MGNSKTPYRATRSGRQVKPKKYLAEPTTSQDEKQRKKKDHRPAPVYAPIPPMGKPVNVIFSVQLLCLLIVLFIASNTHFFFLVFN